MGGETNMNGDTHAAVDGLSPRGRGNRPQCGPAARGVGSIPAWAGKPLGDRRRPEGSGVYPRVGGETRHLVSPTKLAKGLSPRGRGNLSPAPTGSPSGWSIPAWAGKPCRSQVCRRCWRVYPRVGGETRYIGLPLRQIEGLSPRGRGNPAPAAFEPTGAWSIPAWAGKPRLPTCC